MKQEDTIMKTFRSWGIWLAAVALAALCLVGSWLIYGHHARRQRHEKRVTEMAAVLEKTFPEQSERIKMADLMVQSLDPLHRR
jgi:hypothetical protein